MADPTVTLLVAGANSTASTSHTATFAAQPAGTLLTLHFTAEAYPTGDPAGWTRVQWINGSQWMGTGFWYRIATGAETAVIVAVAAAARASWIVAAASNIDVAAPLDTSVLAISSSGRTLTRTYTGPNLTPTPGRRLVVTSMHRIGDAQVTAAAWNNSHAAIGAVSAVGGDHPAAAVGVRTMDGGVAVGQTTVTFTVANDVAWQHAGAVAAFRVTAPVVPGDPLPPLYVGSRRVVKALLAGKTVTFPA